LCVTSHQVPAGQSEGSVPGLRIGFPRMCPTSRLSTFVLGSWFGYDSEPVPRSRNELCSQTWARSNVTRLTKRCEYHRPLATVRAPRPRLWGWGAQHRLCPQRGASTQRQWRVAEPMCVRACVVARACVACVRACVACVRRRVRACVACVRRRVLARAPQDQQQPPCFAAPC